MKRTTQRSRIIAGAALTLAMFVAGGCSSDEESKPARADDKPATTMSKPADSSADTKMGDPESTAMTPDARNKDKTGGGQLPLTEARSVTVTARDSEFGSILFDGDGQVFYLFDADRKGTSTCYGKCAEAWPPVLVTGTPTAGKGAAEAKLGTTTRKDGSMQLTYAGKPMYYYAHEKPGEVKCHNINDNGGLWLVVRPDGSPAPA